jgi:CHAD domain-containing protein
VVDDRVTVTQGGAAVGEFREIEIEMHDDSRTARRAMRAAIDRLTAAGASAEAPMPKLVRALGPRAQAPPDVVVAKLAKAPTIADVVRHAIARSLAQIQRHDPAVRLGDDPEDVHQLRVATRRLRSDLRTFRDILERSQVDRVRAELKWVGTQVGAVRDNDVLRQRITDASIELPEVDKGEAAHLLGHLEVQGKAARTEMLAALRNPRYVSLLDALVDLADTPPFITDTVTTKKMAANRATRFVRRPWRRLASAVAALDADPSDADLHQVRIRAKRCRYAAEAVAPIIGTQAERFAEAVEDIQTVLGDHQDTVVAQTWLRAAARAVPFAGVAAGQLVAGERTRRGNLRRQWPKTWKKASASNLRRWL